MSANAHDDQGDIAALDEENRRAYPVTQFRQLIIVLQNFKRFDIRHIYTALFASIMT